MMYPPAPWTIQGNGFLNLHLLDISRVRSLIPPAFQIVPVLPGKTVGGVYVAYYDRAKSTMEYNELIIVSGLVSHAGKIGSWISHIYVDNPRSVAGGREIWGLPKELAQFEWTGDRLPCVQVRQGDRVLCSLCCTWQSPGLPLPPLTASVFSQLSDQLLLFTAQGQFNLQLIGAKLQVPLESPFAALELRQAWLSFYSNPLKVVAKVPTVQ
ncbi:MAG: acetoacetate decarboxylase family protein [Oscillatoriales cyanobacterium C42_A2020_001]|nr:acetoacetate decarboxylase family protein [Leptolyngbyaceae cyanobacterium C42_A2020_001]